MRGEAVIMNILEKQKQNSVLKTQIDLTKTAQSADKCLA